MANERNDQDSPDISVMRAFAELQTKIPRHHAIAAAQWMLQRATSALVPWAGDEGQTLSEAFNKADKIIISIRRNDRG